MLRLPLPGLWSTLLGSLLAVALTGCVTGSADFEPIEVDGWSHAAAVKVPATGSWICFVSAPYHSGITLRIGRASDGYSLYFAKPEWSLEKGAVYEVDLSIDRLWRAHLEGVAANEAIRVPLGLDAEALNALRLGSVLTMAAQAETFRFELKREAATLDRLEDCFRRRLPAGTAGYRSPFPAAQNPFKVHPRADEASRSPTIMEPAELEQILSQATGLQFRAEPASEFTPSVDLVYILDGHLFGYYWEQSLAGHDVDTVMSLTLAGMQQDCAGRAVSGRHPGRESGLAKIRRGFVSCEENDFFADVLILTREDFAMVFTTSSSLEDAELAENVGAAVGGSVVP